MQVITLTIPSMCFELQVAKKPTQLCLTMRKVIDPYNQKFKGGTG